MPVSWSALSDVRRGSEWGSRRRLPRGPSHVHHVHFGTLSSLLPKDIGFYKGFSHFCHFCPFFVSFCHF